MNSSALQSDHKKPERLQSLDMLRGIAVLMVLMVHAPLPSSLTQLLAGGFLGKVITRLISLGSYGVDLFFVLSGFLISGLLFTEMKRTDHLNVPRFWMRRGLKIWPSYFAAYGVVVAVLCCKDLWQGAARGLVVDRLVAAVPNILFIQNYIPETRWFASWSLAIEEHFYLTFPLLLLLLAAVKRERTGIPILCGVICTVVCMGRIYAKRTGVDDNLIYLQTHFRADSLCFGVFLGYLNQYHRQTFQMPESITLMSVFFLIAVAIPFCFPWGWGCGFMETIGLTIMYLGFGGVVAIAATNPSIGLSSRLGFVVKWLAQVGVYSYTIYLSQWGMLLFTRTKLVDRLLSKLFGSRVDVQCPVFIVTNWYVVFCCHTW